MLVRQPWNIAEQILHCRSFQMRVAVHHGVNAIAHRGSHVREPEPLADHVLALTHLTRRHVNFGNKVTRNNVASAFASLPLYSSAPLRLRARHRLS